MIASFDRIEAVLQAILDHLEGTRPLADVPLHLRGFGVLDEDGP